MGFNFRSRDLIVTSDSLLEQYFREQYIRNLLHFFWIRSASLCSSSNSIYSTRGLQKFWIKSIKIGFLLLKLSCGRIDKIFHQWFDISEQSYVSPFILGPSRDYLVVHRLPFHLLPKVRTRISDNQTLVQSFITRRMLKVTKYKILCPTDESTSIRWSKRESR